MEYKQIVNESNEEYVTPEQVNNLLNQIQKNIPIIAVMGVNDIEFPILKNIENTLVNSTRISKKVFEEFEKQVSGVLNKQRE